MVEAINDFENMILVNTETGEIEGIVDMPDAVQAEALAKWMGERKTWMEGRISALTAERDTWLNKANSIYNPQINKFQAAMNWMITVNKNTLEQYANQLRPTLKGKSKSLKIGLLILKWVARRAKLDVKDDVLAIAWLKKNQLAHAVKISETVLKSEIPDSVKISLTPETGMDYYAGGDEEFKIE